MLMLNIVAANQDEARVLKLPVAGAAHAPALVAFLERQQVVDQAGARGLRGARPRRRPRRRARHRCRIRAPTSPRASRASCGSDLRPLARPGPCVDRAGRGAAARVQPRMGTQPPASCAASRRKWQLRSTSRCSISRRRSSRGSLMLFLVAFYGLFAALMGGTGRRARRHRRRARARSRWSRC